MLIFLLLCVSVRSFITPPLSSFPGLKSATATASVCSAWKSRMKGRIPAHLRTVWARQRPQPCCRSTVRNTSCILYLNTHTHTHFCMHKKSHVPRACVHAYTNMQSHDNSIIQIPISCPTLSVFISVHLSPRPVVLPRAYAKPNGLRHLTDVW